MIERNGARWAAVALTICTMFILAGIGGTMVQQRAEREHAEKVQIMHLELTTPLPERNPRRQHVRR